MAKDMEMLDNSYVEPTKTRLRLRIAKIFNPMILTGVAILLTAALIAIFADQLAPKDPTQTYIRERLSPPVFAGGNLEFPLGTDQTGRDILSNLIFGLRISLSIGIGATLLSMIIGWIIGLISGYFGGRIENLLMRVTDMQLSLPIELVAFITLAILGNGLWILILVIGLTGWPEYARTARASTLGVRSREYVESAIGLGASTFAILRRHILPNIAVPVIVLMGVQLPRVIMLESALSFLGVGVPVTTPSLGLLTSRGFQVLFSGNWWVAVFPGITLMFLTLGINLVVDGVRDYLDPHSRK